MMNETRIPSAGPLAAKALAAATAMGLLAAPVAAQELSYGSFLQPTARAVADGMIPYFDRVAERTNGDVTFKAFWGGAMGGPKELLGSVESGAIDAALLVDIYTKKALPHPSALSALFIVADDPLVFAGALNEYQLIGCESCQKDFQNNGQKGLGWYSTTSYLLQCTSDIHTLEDLKGKKVRAVSRLATLMDNMGAVPVSVTVAEMYEAMQRGQVDCALASAYYLNTYNIKDFVTSIVDTPIGAYIGTLPISINLDVWEDMAPESRKVMLEEMPKLLADIQFVSQEDDENAIADTVAKGGKVGSPDQAFLDKLEELRGSEWEAVIAQAKADGVDDADALYAGFRELIEKWRGIVGEGLDREGYEEALRREVFSKLEP